MDRGVIVSDEEYDRDQIENIGIIQQILQGYEARSAIVLAKLLILLLWYASKRRDT